MKAIKVDELVIEGVTYVPKDTVSKQAQNTEGLDCVMIRTYSAGVHYGYLESKRDANGAFAVKLLNARRVWQWSGAASLSQLSMDGTSKPDKCKMPCSVSSIELMAIEIIPMTEKAVESLNNVEVWKQ